MKFFSLFVKNFLYKKCPKYLIKFYNMKKNSLDLNVYYNKILKIFLKGGKK